MSTNQGEELSKRCVPDMKKGKPCTYAIGVLAVSNCSYAIQVRESVIAHSVFNVIVFEAIQ